MNKMFKQVLSFIAVLALAAVACNLPLFQSAAQNGGVIGGTVTSDLYENGISEGGEGPLEGVLISLSGCGENKTVMSGTEAGEYLIEFQELATECGDHSLTLVVTDPNQKSASDDFTVNGVP